MTDCHLHLPQCYYIEHARVKVLNSSSENESTADPICLLLMAMGSAAAGLRESDACTLSLLLIF